MHKWMLWVGLLAIAGCGLFKPSARVEDPTVSESPSPTPGTVESKKVEGEVGLLPEPVEEPEYLITSDSMGPARLGMTLGELRQKLGNRLTLGEPEPFLVDFDAIPVLDGDEVVFYIMYGNWQPMQDSDKIEYLVTENPRVMTAAGIGPGSSIAAAEGVYGSATLGYNLEAESREGLRFEDFPWANYWIQPEVLTNSASFAGVYDESETSSYRETTEYRDDAVIGSIVIDLRF